MSNPNKRLIVLILILLLSTSAQLLQAQADDVTQLANNLDQQASAKGLPLGDGTINPAEQSLASSMVDEITRFGASLLSFEDASPENTALVDAVEQRTVQYDQEITAAGSNADTRLQIISDAVAEYGMNRVTYQAANSGILNDMLADSLSEYRTDAVTAYTGPIDPQVQAVIDQVNSYLAEDALRQDMDPQVRAVYDQVKAYLAESEAREAQAAEDVPAMQDSAVQAVIDAVNDYLNNSNKPRKKLLQDHMEQIIEDAVPRARIDLMSGIYSYGPNEVTRSGDCSDYTGGDADGPGAGGYQPEDPTFQAHVCFAYPYGIVTVDGDVFQAFGGTSSTSMPNLYQTDTSVSSFDNSQMHKELVVTSETTFDVTMVIQAGSCTITSTTHYSIYAPGAPFGCNPNSKVWNVGDDQIDLETGEEIEAPEDITEPEDVIIDPIIAGEYSVSWLPFSDQCDADYLPTFDTVTLTPTSFNTVNLSVLGETFQFGSGGMDEGLSGRFDMLADNNSGTLERRLPTDFNFTWLAMSEDNQQSCSARGLLTLGTAADEQPVFDPPFAGGDTGSGVVDPNAGAEQPEVAIASGTYAVTWAPIPGLECPADLEAQMPAFTEATLEINGTAALIAGDETFPLTAMAGGYVFTEFGEDGSGVTISLAGAAAGQVAGSYTRFTPDGQMCLLSMTLDQQ